MFLFFFFAGFAATGATTAAAFFFAGFVVAGTTAAAAFFFAAQRRFKASTIRFRPSGLSFLFLAGFAAAGAAKAIAFFGLPAFFFAAGAVPPLSNTRARCNWAISRSIVARMSE